MSGSYASVRKSRRTSTDRLGCGLSRLNFLVRPRRVRDTSGKNHPQTSKRSQTAPTHLSLSQNFELN